MFFNITQHKSAPKSVEPKNTWLMYLYTICIYTNVYLALFTHMHMEKSHVIETYKSHIDVSEKYLLPSIDFPYLQWFDFIGAVGHFWQLLWLGTAVKPQTTLPWLLKQRSCNGWEGCHLGPSVSFHGIPWIAYKNFPNRHKDGQVIYHKF